MKRPIVNIEALKFLAQAIVAWVVVMEIWPMSPVQQGATLSLALAFINVLGGYFQNDQTTPLVAPQARDGEPLVRSSAVNRTRSANTDLRKAA